jgi:hypothetical protein
VRSADRAGRLVRLATGDRLPVLATAFAAVLVSALGVALGVAPLLPRAPVPGAVGGPAEAQAPTPVRLRIPAIGVDAPLGPLDVDPAGVLPPPAANDAAGWWRAGPEPGEPGAAVIAGHVDSRTGPAVFFRLREVGPGDEILVDRADGSTAVFTAREVQRHGKDAFPTATVYARGPDAELRLVTCGGEFDHARHRYRENVIVFAARST